MRACDALVGNKRTKEGRGSRASLIRIRHACGIPVVHYELVALGKQVGSHGCTHVSQAYEPNSWEIILQREIIANELMLCLR